MKALAYFSQSYGFETFEKVLTELSSGVEFDWHYGPGIHLQCKITDINVGDGECLVVHRDDDREMGWYKLSYLNERASTGALTIV